jgi:acyl carrier protein
MVDREHIRQFISEYLALPIQRLLDDASLSSDLNLDSFKLIILHMALEEECGVEVEPDENMSTVGEMIDSMLAAQTAKPQASLRIVPKASGT